MNARVFLSLILFSVLDVGTLFLLAHYTSVGTALFLVLCSTILGLLACARWIKRLAEQHEKLREEYGEKIPRDLILVRGSEGLLSLVAVILFLYPGLLSDLMGFLLAFPRVQADSAEIVVKLFQSQAKKEGKSVAELFQ